MIAIILIGLAAGCASALMFASIISGALISLLLFYLAPLPLMVAALGWGPLAATIGGIAAAIPGVTAYVTADLPAGKHVITSQGEGSRLEMNTEAGKIYYVWQEVKMGMLSGGSKLQLVAEDVGRKGVTESTRIQANP